MKDASSDALEELCKLLIFPMPCLLLMQLHCSFCPSFAAVVFEVSAFSAATALFLLLMLLGEVCYTTGAVGFLWDLGLGPPARYTGRRPLHSVPFIRKEQFGDMEV